MRFVKMKEKINSIKNQKKYLTNSQRIHKSKSLFNNINNIRIIRENKSDDEDDNNNSKTFNKIHYGKGNFFYDDLSDKYFYDYYRYRNINCPACIIGNSNTDRGFSPIICCRLIYKSEDYNIDNKKENDIK